MRSMLFRWRWRKLFLRRRWVPVGVAAALVVVADAVTLADLAAEGGVAEEQEEEEGLEVNRQHSAN